MATRYIREDYKRSIDRLYEFAKWCKEEGHVRTLSEWESECGIGSRYLTNTLQSTKGSVGAEILEKVYERFPMVNLTYIITGYGTMIDNVIERIDRNEQRASELEEKIAKYQEVIELTKKTISAWKSIQNDTDRKKY